MGVPTVQSVISEIRSITDFLVSKGIVDDQNYPYRREASGSQVFIEYTNIMIGSSMLREKPYAETYYEQLHARSFNFRMLDGALVQMTYTFKSKALTGGRLAFLPSPDLSEYQNDPELYMEDVIFSEVVDRRVVTVPLRFDFDTRDGVVQEINHPKSHLTLGQYENCRIAATAAITPGSFMEFILRSFYNTASRKYSELLPYSEHRFDRTITHGESQLLHISIP